MQIPSQVESPWSKSSAAVAEALETSLDVGLDDAQAASRLQAEGLNRLERQERRGPLRLFLGQFADFMVGLLVAAAVISGLVGDWTDTVLIGAILLANAIIGFLQEWKADNAIQALKKLSQPVARVRRAGEWRQLPAEQIVRGDLVKIQAGDFVPADVRLFATTDLETNESPLTGESLPVEKHPEPVQPESPLPDRTGMAYAGTAVARGHGTGIVVAIGLHTELGHIARLLESTTEHATPLQRQLAVLTRRIAIAVLIVAIFIFVVGVLREPVQARGRALYTEMLLTAVSLAVAAIPEGLPAVITITLALGSQRMARRKAIIRKLSAVETLGSVDVICSDKTGTLTQSQMKVTEIIAVNQEPAGEQLALEAAVLCNNAEVGTGGEILGSATEAALLAAAQSAGMDLDALKALSPRVNELPFSSERKLMATLHEKADGTRRLFVKGASDHVIPLCRSAGETLLENYEQRAVDLARSGRRVLAVAQSPNEQRTPDLDFQPGTLELLGLFGLSDPIRPEIPDALRNCESAGIQTIMITGDHPETARAVGQELGLFTAEAIIVTGTELEQMADEELERRVEQIRAYARVSPQHKLRIVGAWKARGKTVAMTGDGVNDAPALKQADIGVAMGITGTEVSKQAANMILADDNFATIVGAVEEGRVIYDNMRKFVGYLLTANLSEVLVLVGAILLGWPLPLLPVHLLWINLVTDGLPALALGFESAERDIMQKPPRPAGQSLLSGDMAGRIFAMGSVMAACCLALCWYGSGGFQWADNLPRARTLTFFSLATAQLFYVFGMRSLTTPLSLRGLWENYRLTVAVLLGFVLQLATVFVPALRSVLHLVPLTMYDLAFAILVSTIPLIALELLKRTRNQNLATAKPHALSNG